MPLVLLEDSEEYLKRFGQKVKQLRIANNMTMQELADKCGYSSRATINKIEKGEINVSQSKIKALASALGVSPVDLLGADEATKDDGYYFNEDTAQIAQQIYEDKELRALFDAARGADPEALQAAQAMLKVLKRKERGS